MRLLGEGLQGVIEATQLRSIIAACARMGTILAVTCHLNRHSYYN